MIGGGGGGESEAAVRSRPDNQETRCRKSRNHASAKKLNQT